MHDNAPIHGAGVVQEALEEVAFEVLDWPAYSPDLNPIENLWHILKERIHHQNPLLATLNSNAASLEALVRAANTVWDQITQEEVNALVDSMPRRIAALEKARGWYTKY